jgi:hypothetical protein
MAWNIVGWDSEVSLLSLPASMAAICLKVFWWCVSTLCSIFKKMGDACPLLLDKFSQCRMKNTRDRVREPLE